MENNTNLTGDEARVLMAALMNAHVSLPTNVVLQLYMRLAAISNVQPPKAS